MYNEIIDNDLMSETEALVKKIKKKFSPNNNNETSGAKEKDPNIILWKELTFYWV